jgi:hypothetical protein
MPWNRGTSWNLGTVPSIKGNERLRHRKVSRGTQRHIPCHGANALLREGKRTSNLEPGS